MRCNAARPQHDNPKWALYETLVQTGVLTDSKEVGLAVGLVLGENFLGMSDLHYGLWPADLPLSIPNLPVAQRKYTEYLVSHIPPTTRRILDVGSGAGRTAKALLARGFGVDCVSPSSFLTQRVKAEVGEKAEIFSMRFEDLVTERRYDLLLFSESFQYVDPVLALAKAAGLLTSCGTVLICDFFRRDAGPHGPLGGGHVYDKFLREVAEGPFEVCLNEDLTELTAPTMELFGRVLKNAGVPIRDLVTGLIAHRHPILAKLIAWRLRGRFEKINRKYFSGELSGENFKAFKTYRLLCLRTKQTH